MFRRCLSLCLIAGFFASQLAGVPHAHGAVSGETQHAAKPHFHFGCDHYHGHSHSGCRHSHDGQPNQNASESRHEAGSRSLAIGLPSEEHDADAIFVGEHTAVIAASKVKIDTAAHSIVAFAPLAASLDPCGLIAQTSRTLRPPDQVLDDSDTYLTLRNLRI